MFIVFMTSNSVMDVDMKLFLLMQLFVALQLQRDSCAFAKKCIVYYYVYFTRAGVK